MDTPWLHGPWWPRHGKSAKMNERRKNATLYRTVELLKVENDICSSKRDICCHRTYLLHNAGQYEYFPLKKSTCSLARVHMETASKIALLYGLLCRMTDCSIKREGSHSGTQSNLLEHPPTTNPTHFSFRADGESSFQASLFFSLPFHSPLALP
jgi:hypothetical protein